MNRSLFLQTFSLLKDDFPALIDAFDTFLQAFGFVVDHYLFQRFFEAIEGFFGHFFVAWLEHVTESHVNVPVQVFNALLFLINRV